MVPHHLYYHLVVSGLLWECFSYLRRKHSNNPKPCADLTHKPPCAAYVQRATHPTPHPPVPPDLMALPKRRPRRVDTSRRFCPHAGGRYRGRVGLGNLRANGGLDHGVGHLISMTTEKRMT